MEFSRGFTQRVSGKFIGQLKKKWCSMGAQEKLMRNFHGSWLVAFEFPMVATQFCIISIGESLFSLEFLRVK